MTVHETLGKNFAQNPDRETKVATLASELGPAFAAAAGWGTMEHEDRKSAHQECSLSLWQCLLLTQPENQCSARRWNSCSLLFDPWLQWKPPTLLHHMIGPADLEDHPQEEQVSNAIDLLHHRGSE